MKRLLMISYPFPPNASAGAVRSERIARYLPHFGWDVEVVTIRPRLDMFKDKDRLKNLGEGVGLHFTETIDPWLWLKDMNTQNRILKACRSVLMSLFSFPDHTLLWIPFAVNLGLKVNRRNPIDVIYTTSPPHSTHLTGLFLSRTLKKPWIADFRDPWTLNAFRSQSKIHNLLLHIERLLEKAVLRRAAKVLANTRANKRNLLKAFPFLGERKVVYLPNGWEEFSVGLPDERKNGVLTIVHTGNFYSLFKPYGLFYAIAKWRKGIHSAEVPAWMGNIRIILFGCKDSATLKVIQDLSLGDIVEIRPWLALDKARQAMFQADLLWTSLGTGRESSTYIPSKIFEYIATRRPIIGFFPKGEAESLIRETGIGKVFTSDDPLPVIKFLNQCLAYKKAGKQLNYNPNQKVVDSMKVQNLMGQMAEILEMASNPN